MFHTNNQRLFFNLILFLYVFCWSVCGASDFVYLWSCLYLKKPPLLQVKTELVGEGGKKMEVVSKCQTDGQHPQTLSLALHLLLRHAPLFALAENQNHLRPAPATRPTKRPWIWTK